MTLDQQIDQLADEAARCLAEAVIAETPEQAADQVYAECRRIIAKAVRLGQQSLDGLPHPAAP